MTDTDKSLSFLLDGFSGDDNGGAVDAVAADVNLQYRARRYRMIGEVLRNELPPAIDTGFHDSVMARIREQGLPVHGSPRHDMPARDRSRLLDRAWLKPLGGFAVAATVAMVTILVWRPLDRDLSDPVTLSRADEERIDHLKVDPWVDAVPASTTLQSPGTRWNIGQDMPGMQKKLNAYLVNHTEYSNSVQGLIPQARVAGFDAQR